MDVMKPVRAVLRSKRTKAALAWIIFVFVRMINMSLRTKFRNIDKLDMYLKTAPVILVFWHSRALAVSKARGKIGGKARMSGIFSLHRDGFIIAKIYKFLGLGNILTDKNSRAQTAGVTFRAIEALNSGITIGITPDGPKGPDMTFVTDSVFLFAKRTGVPIVPIYTSANRVWRLKTWDRFMIVKPFAKSIIEVGNFVKIPEDATDGYIAEIKAMLTETMRKKTRELDNEMGMK